jgi:hypothetical protein
MTRLGALSVVLTGLLLRHCRIGCHIPEVTAVKIAHQAGGGEDPSDVLS